MPKIGKLIRGLFGKKKAKTPLSRRINLLRPSHWVSPIAHEVKINDYQPFEEPEMSSASPKDFLAACEAMDELREGDTYGLERTPRQLDELLANRSARKRYVFGRLGDRALQRNLRLVALDDDFLVDILDHLQTRKEVINYAFVREQSRRPVQSLRQALKGVDSTELKEHNEKISEIDEIFHIISIVRTALFADRIREKNIRHSAVGTGHAEDLRLLHPGEFGINEKTPSPYAQSYAQYLAKNSEMRGILNALRKKGRAQEIRDKLLEEFREHGYEDDASDHFRLDDISRYLHKEGGMERVRGILLGKTK